MYWLDCECFFSLVGLGQADSVEKRGGGSKRSGHDASSMRKINTYFFKKQKIDGEACILTEKEVPALKTTNTSNENCFNDNDSNNVASTSVATKRDMPSTSSAISNDSLNSEFASDIGSYINENMNQLSDSTRALLLEKHWMPPSNYVFPHNVVIKLGKPSKKFAQRSHLEKFHWLVLSHVDQGLYCKYCALFATTATDFARSNLRRLVKEPLKVFDRLLGENGLLIQHQRNHYHQMAVESGKNFLACYHKPELDIVNQISTQRMAQIMENRDRLRPIIKTIIFCGRQNIPLRGHRDDGQFFSTNTDKSVVSAPEGNFRALLKFRIDAGDTVLQHHLATASSNVTYISKTVQNELIDICKEKIQENILQNVKNAKFFSLLFDETTDISHTEQLSLSFRYYNNGVIKEDFICFCDAYEMLRCEEADSSKELRLTGVALAKIVENLCHKFDIDLTFCVGIGTDSCSVMASDVKGAVQELTKKAIHAKRCPCNNHVLNNSLANSSKVASCRNTSATMKKIVAFANASAKRHEVFLQELGGVAIQSICETRWVERHDGHLQFQGDNLIKICNALERISTWKDSKTSSDAHCLLQTLRSSDFIISSVCLNDILGTTVALSRFLQTASIDMKRATDAIKDTLDVLKSKRENVDSVFQQLFSEAREVAKQLDVELKSSRTISRQTHRSNHPAQSVEEYIRRSIYVPLLDCVINDLSQRLSPDVLDLFQLGVFLPKSTYSDQDIDTVRKVVQMYQPFLDGSQTSSVVNEYRLWMIKWKREIKNKSPIPESRLLKDHFQLYVESNLGYVPQWHKRDYLD
ncbi:PREDICTED: 52 kDa repressor of the inhibitor of the protein kinase-like [Trachymyrmex cornetzi]|uniref:52 kDa repressor of the inhibitor of the protein kinase-like n=1 Tax=Trachymyrmex cornetzi TaxID=471704 RepID=UPI00084F7DA9|nr:PREDICTED: 52 kDa repressor of the inhibitor of the protein kinase-like [Trachymyrmex cornetzi]